MLIHFMVVVQFHVYSKCSVLLDVAENKIPLMYGKWLVKRFGYMPSEIKTILV